MLLGIWLLGATFWCGWSNRQAATARMGTRQAEFSLGTKTYCGVPTTLKSIFPLSLTTLGKPPPRIVIQRGLCSGATGGTMPVT